MKKTLLGLFLMVTVTIGLTACGTEDFSELKDDQARADYLGKFLDETENAKDEETMHSRIYNFSSFNEFEKTVFQDFKSKNETTKKMKAAGIKISRRYGNLKNMMIQHTQFQAGLTFHIMENQFKEMPPSPSQPPSPAHPNPTDTAHPPQDKSPLHHFSFQNHFQTLQSFEPLHSSASSIQNTLYFLLTVSFAPSKIQGFVKYLGRDFNFSLLFFAIFLMSFTKSRLIKTGSSQSSSFITSRLNSV